MYYSNGDLVRLGLNGNRHVNRNADPKPSFFLWGKHDSDCVKCLTDELFVVCYPGPGYIDVEPLQPLVDGDGNVIDLIDADVSEVTALSPLELLALEGI